MGFFAKVKQFLGIGGVKVKLMVDEKIKKPAGDRGVIKGSVAFTSKSIQKVLSIEVELKEDYSTGSGENRSTKEYDLGEVSINEQFEIKPGDTKTIDFSLPFTFIKSTTQNMAEKKGVLGALGKVGSFANNEKSEYKIIASAKVEGTALGPNDVKIIDFIK